MEQNNISKVKGRLSERIPVFFVMSVFVLLSISTLTAWFRGDTEIYYQGICQSVDNLKKGELSLSNFQIAGHMCYGYSIFVFLGQLFIPYHGIGIRLVNILLAAVTIELFWEVLGIIFPKIDRWMRLLATAAFAFSPLLLGIIGEVHSDLPVLCFFIWLVYFYLTKRQIACLIAGFLLCFSKEIGILYYCSFFAGCFLYRLVKNENRNWLKKLYDEFSVYEWMLLIPADLFLVCAIYSGSWGAKALTTTVTASQVDSIHWEWDYVSMKLREIFLMNFSWLLFVPLILFIIAACRRKLLNTVINREWLTGIGVSTCVFLLFNVSYYTYLHYRYLQIFLFFYMLLMIFLLEKVCQNVWLKRGFSLLLAAAFLVESFVTVDPVTYLAFRNIDVGNGKVVTTDDFIVRIEEERKIDNGKIDRERIQFLDAGVYNRDYLGFEKVLEEAMADIGYDSTKAIVFPAFYRNTIEYTVYGYLGTHNPWVLYWDSDTGDITYDEGKIWIRWTDISKGIPENISDYSEVWYVRLPYYGEWYDEENLKYFHISEEHTYQSGKWKIMLERLEYQG